MPLAVVNVRGKNNNRELWAVDCETDPFKRGRIPKPFIWGAYNGSEYHTFENAADLIAFLSVRTCLVYAHNGGRYDWHYILEHLEPFSAIMVIAGRLARFRIGGAEFRDSWNIMPMPLRAGGAKLEIEDFSIFEADQRDIPANREVIRERVRTDCIYLFRMLEKFISEFGLHLTQAGASMHAWSAISSISPPKTNREFYQRFYPFYFGGRVECFQPGIIERPFKAVDKNSAYSHAMIHRHPWGEIPDEHYTLPVGRSAIERSFITLESNATGAFPFRERDGSLGFPADGTGRIFHVTGWEYLAALETGTLHKHSIHSVLRLPASIDFRSYMDYFYRMKTDAKASGDKARYEFAKRFLNSLYGKFGSDPEDYDEFTIVSPRFIEAACDADGYQFCAELGPWALLSRDLPEERQHYYNVAVAASVTGFVRADMWRAIRSVRDCIYVDTDCLHCSDTGNLKLDENELGAWKVEATCDFGAYAGKKLYAVRTSPDWQNAHPHDKIWKVASKGVRLTHEEIIAVASGADYTTLPEVPQYSVKNGIRFQPRTVRRTTMRPLTTIDCNRT